MDSFTRTKNATEQLVHSLIDSGYIATSQSKRFGSLTTHIHPFISNAAFEEKKLAVSDAHSMIMYNLAQKLTPDEYAKIVAILQFKIDLIT